MHNPSLNVTVQVYYEYLQWQQQKLVVQGVEAKTGTGHHLTFSLGPIDTP